MPNLVKFGGDTGTKEDTIIWSYIKTLNGGTGITAYSTDDCVVSDSNTSGWYSGHSIIGVLKTSGNGSNQTNTAHTFTFNFTKPINAIKHIWSNRGGSNNRRLDTYRVQYSDDNSTWVTAFERTGMGVGDKAERIVSDLNTDGKAHKYWRVYESSATDNHIDILWMDFVVKA